MFKVSDGALLGRQDVLCGHGQQALSPWVREFMQKLLLDLERCLPGQGVVPCAALGNGALKQALGLVCC